MKKWILLALAILPVTASAQSPEFFQGKWKGKGTYILDGRISSCDSFNLVFAGTDNSFEFVTGDRKCEFHQEKFDNVKMDYRDGELYFYGQKVGALKDNELTANYSVPEGDGRIRHWRMAMRRQGNHLMYEESRTMDNNSTPLISFSGMLILDSSEAE